MSLKGENYSVSSIINEKFGEKNFKNKRNAQLLSSYGWES